MTAPKLAVWKRLLAANKALQKANAQLSAAAFWISNLVVAILFGLGHLPSASLVMPITPLVVAVALSFNGIAAVGFGVLYRNEGWKLR